MWATDAETLIMCVCTHTHTHMYTKNLENQIINLKEEVDIICLVLQQHFSQIT